MKRANAKDTVSYDKSRLKKRTTRTFLRITYITIAFYNTAEARFSMVSQGIWAIKRFMYAASSVL